MTPGFFVRRMLSRASTDKSQMLKRLKPHTHHPMFAPRRTGLTPYVPYRLFSGLSTPSLIERVRCVSDTKIKVIGDTETTGFGKKHELVSVGFVVTEDNIVTDKQFHQFIKPRVSVSPGAFKVHGLSDKFLSQFPHFEEVSDEILSFMRQGPLVFHNLNFDLGFLNRAFSETDASFTPIEQQFVTLDTLAMAKACISTERGECSLDALCKRYNVDLSERELHGALLDALLLARMFPHLLKDFFEMYKSLENEETPKGPSV